MTMSSTFSRQIKDSLHTTVERIFRGAHNSLLEVWAVRLPMINSNVFFGDGQNLFSEVRTANTVDYTLFYGCI